MDGGNFCILSFALVYFLAALKTTQYGSLISYGNFMMFMFSCKHWNWKNLVFSGTAQTSYSNNHMLACRVGVGGQHL